MESGSKTSPIKYLAERIGEMAAEQGERIFAGLVRMGMRESERLGERAASRATRTMPATADAARTLNLASAEDMPATAREIGAIPCNMIWTITSNKTGKAKHRRASALRLPQLG